MALFIHQPYLKLIKKFPIWALIFCSLMVGCNEQAADTRFPTMKVIEMELPTKKKIKTWVSITETEQKKGLSFLKEKEFKEDEAMLFIGLYDKARQFWMPNTFFNLDLFFLDKDFYVINIHRDLPHYTKREPHSNVPRSKTVYCRHVLELKANSPLAQHIQIGSQIKWLGKTSLEQIIQDTRQRQ